MKRRARIRGVSAAFCAVFAMFLQTVTAACAMAEPAAQTMVICTAHGAQTIVLDEPGAPAGDQKAACAKCDHCTPPAVAAPPQPANPAASVRYATLAAARHESPALSPYSARAPPRPPSQGPPQLLNV